MISPRDNMTELTPDERSFVKRLAEQYSPPPMTASERVAFDEALQSRLSRRRTWVLKPLAVAATAAVLAIWVILHSPTEPDRSVQKRTGPQAVLETPNQQEGVGDVLLELAFDEPNEFDADRWLPEDYVGISTLLNNVGG